MKYLRPFSLALVFFVCASKIFSQEYRGVLAEKIVPQTEIVQIGKLSSVPSLIVFKESGSPNTETFMPQLRKILLMKTDDDLSLYRQEKDNLGFTHYRYRQTYKGYIVEDAEYLIHTKNGAVKSANGTFFDHLEIPVSVSITEEKALEKALLYVGAEKYKWQNSLDEKRLKQTTNNTHATYYPKGELVITAVHHDYKNKPFRLAYKFDIYASQPLSRNYIYVDAQTGEVINQFSRIHYTDTVGTANTMYSGTQNITTDSFGGGYRLRETGRGGGIETYDISGNDFTDSDNNWTSTTQPVYAAHDAHWSAEGIYDYYYNTYGRNSFDNAGAKVLVYVEDYYDNAYWDGSSIHFGLGSTIFTPLTSPDVVGHEFTHGVTEFSAGLVYANEPGALNESFSDIFGTVLEYYQRPSQWDYAIGGDIMLSGPPALRYMDNPNGGYFPQPDTYLGTYWDPFEEVHTNSGVQNFWFYLVAEGGTGTNDNGDNYSVTGISIDKAAAISFRNLTVYLTPNSDYAEARTLSIQAAKDLYGPCSQEVITVTDAWYAVGVGAIYNPNTVADFFANSTFSCSVPAPVSFTNTSNNANIFFWDFGDGNTDTVQSPTHTYTAAGTYTVELIATATGPCGSGTDTIIQINYITITNGGGPIPASCSATTLSYCCGMGIYNITFNTINNTTNDGSDGYQDYSCSNQTSITAGVPYNVSIQTNSSYNENVRVWIDYDNDGAFNVSTELAFSSDNILQNHSGTIMAPGTVIYNTPLRMRVVSDYASSNPPQPCTDVDYGQFEDYTVTILPNTNPPVADFTANTTTTCNGIINFTDLSQNIPTSWFWDFGDGNTDTLQNPTHVYTADGIYTISLIVTNAYGTDTIVKVSYINVTLGGPIAALCTPSTLFYCCGYGIYNVTFNTINNSTADGADGYKDYSCTQQTSITAGVPYNISIQTDSIYQEDVRVWIDYNNDGAFNVSTELAFSSDNILQNHSGTIMAPGTVIYNTPLRMRVVSDYASTNPPPCTDVYYGQFEDYTVTILPNTNPPQTDFSAILVEICAGDVVDFADMSFNFPTSWSWTFSGGVPSSSALQNPSVQYSTPGLYDVTLTATNIYGSDTETKTAYIKVDSIPNVTLSAFSDVCVNAPAFTLTGGSPSGGIYSGTGVSGSSFNPSTAGVGSHTITYTYTKPIGSGTNYIVNQIGIFSPISGSGTGVILNDDAVSTVLPIGFTFNFYGVNYINFYISSNGFITFNSGSYDGCCSGDYLPNNSANPSNLIAFAWDDLYPPGGGTINYFTTGSAPNRKLIVNFNNVPTFCGTSQITSQVILYESTNIIEIHTTSSDYCNAMTMGIENNGGTVASAVSGRNSAMYSITNDFVQFTYPGCTNSASQNINVNPSPPFPTITQSGNDLVSSSTTGNQWYRNGILISGAMSQTYTPTQNGNYTVTVTDVNGCSSTSAPLSYTVGITESVKENSIQIYPNPAKNQLSIQIDFAKTTSADIKIYNLLGIVMFQSHDDFVSNKLYSINLSSYAMGMYYVEIRTSEGVIVRRIQVSR